MGHCRLSVLDILLHGINDGFLFFVCAVKQFNVIIRFNSFHRLTVVEKQKKSHNNCNSFFTFDKKFYFYQMLNHHKIVEKTHENS